MRQTLQEACIVGELTLRAARARLRDGLARLPELARALEQPGVLREQAEWSLVLDEQDAAGMTLRANFDPALRADMPNPTAALPLSELLEPLQLDRLTVADDARFLESLAQQPNLPEYVKTGLPKLY